MNEARAMSAAVRAERDIFAARREIDHLRQRLHEVGAERDRYHAALVSIAQGAPLDEPTAVPSAVAAWALRQGGAR
ncbi:MAG: hypothetical protein FD160_3764 [Caulobacteraceae bacterium]|nr:MAG: hypothetical protein FD160_3764 [Caulobacteraceae bacterium]